MGKDIDRNITRQLWERLKNTFLKYKLPEGGYNITNILIGTNGLRMTIQDDMLYLMGNFSVGNVFHLQYANFVPFI